MDNAVKETTCELHNPLIIGYAVLPENPQLHSEPEMLTFTGTANRVEVTVLYEKGAFPDETEMHLETIWKKDVIDAISETVKEDNKEVVRVQAVDKLSAYRQWILPSLILKAMRFIPPGRFR